MPLAPILTDFGLAKRSGEETLTADGQVLGTPAYMPPEFAAGRAVGAGPAADVYGLGGVLYALLTGRPPFAGGTPLETLRKVAEEDPVRPRAVNPTVDRGIEAVCLKCLEKDPGHRYRSAAEVADDLDRYLAGESPRAEHLGWREWCGRQLSRAVDFSAAGRWGRLLQLLAGLVFVSYLLMQVGTRGVNEAWVYWAWFLGVSVATTWGPCLVLAARCRLDPRERELLLAWAGVSVGRVVLFANACPPGGPVEGAEVFRFFPAALALDGVMLFAEGRLYWGRLYLFGLAGFAVALGLLLALPAAPVVYGAWHALVLAAIDRHLRRVAAGRVLSTEY